MTSKSKSQLAEQAEDLAILKGGQLLREESKVNRFALLRKHQHRFSLKRTAIVLKAVGKGLNKNRLPAYSF